MPMSILPAERPLADAILAAGLAVSDDRASRLERAGFADVRATDWAILRLLPHGGVPVSHLARPLEITQQATSKAIRSLEHRDYVTRLGALDDNRVREVWLTARGWALLAAADRWAGDHHARAVDRWGLHDVRRAATLLTGVVAASARYSGPGRNLRSG